MKKTCLVAFAFAAGLAASAFAQVAPPSVRYVEHPQAARIGEGEGVVFRVRAEIDPPGRITGYQWRLNGLPLIGETRPEYRIESASPAIHAGNISVVVYATHGFTAPSRNARLDVVNNDWAHLSGRTLSPSVAPHTPSLSRCGGALVLAWVERVGPFPGVAALRASRYDGAAWAPLDWASLTGTSGHHASDPSLGCARFEDRDWIVAAWTESAFVNGPKTMHVKRFDDTRWQPVGPPLAASPTLAPSHPVLRLVGEEADNRGGTLVAKASVRGYLNGGRMRYERWDGVQWVMLGDGTPHTGAAPAVALDTITRPTALGRTWAPLQLANHRVGVGQSQLGVTSSQTLWQTVGDPLGPVVPSSASRQLVGLGMAALNGVPQAVAVWRNGTGPRLESAMLTGQDYLDAFTTTQPPAAVRWLHYADALTLSVGTFTTAFDDEAYRGACVDRRSFALALADASSTRILRAVCTASSNMAWTPLGTALPNRPVTMALKMQDFEHPVLALVENGAIQVLKWIALP